MMNALPMVLARAISETRQDAAEHQKIAKYVCIPILYLTDRAQQGESYATRRRYASMCEHEMYYGTAHVVVPNTSHKADIGMFKRLGWSAAKRPAGRVCQKDRIDPTDHLAAKQEFFNRLKMSLDQSAQDNVCVFVHGACDPFEQTMQHAALLAYYLEKPLVVYAWPAASRLRSYFIDATNNEWSQGHFNIFCRDLLSLREEHPVTVTFVSHSMGNRLVIRSLPITYGMGLVTHWELVSPDIDADTTRHYILGMKADNSHIRLYVSNRDRLLALSQMIGGGYYRLGEAMNKVALPPELCHQTPDQIERIDFTDVDSLFGHAIPFQLIASMVNSNSPGPRLKLVPETQVKAIPIVSFANRIQKLGETTGNLPAQYCKRVVREGGR